MEEDTAEEPANRPDKEKRQRDEMEEIERKERKREEKRERKRREMEGAKESASKIMRNEGETRGELTRDVDPGEGFRNAEGKMVDSVDAVEWMETLDDIAMHKTR